ncbi:hypothetical protein I580_01862 [Enterococcus caccae ATCC BAA-1240]|uniref:Uncharacterized protein n=1 Tax=Enterococcus caccae ATCC BAA-1240 TaxID=1158612 RepID=R3TVY5_9ENTE|nr:hypothetical protein UC7_01561 [Enterococcus caccae ATCC BAA-1240]EOT60960.1 hypothetical protein I580_01862 [Enterococcus caccae ATCC BAA-1240]
MITRNSRKLLKIIIKISNNKISRLSYNHTYSTSIEKIFFQDEFRLYLSELDSAGLVKLRIVPDTTICVDFALTFQGLRYFAWRAERFKQFLFTSIFIPILVSAVTSIVLFWINKLLI